MLDPAGLDGLIAALIARGFTVLGPTIGADAVTYAPLTSSDALPVGIHDEQAPGRYRLRTGEDPWRFAFASTPASFKPWLLPADQILWRARQDQDWRVVPADDRDDISSAARPPFALLGVRGCDLAALAALDRVLAERWGTRPGRDPDYVRRRESLFVVAVDCSHPSATCFCTSMGTGPQVGAGFDLAVTEVLGGNDGRGHRFVVRTGTERGSEVLAEVVAQGQGREASSDDLDEARQVLVAAEQVVRRRVADTDRGTRRDLLYSEVENPRWDSVAERCLACGNCTAVCPTCFCTSISDVSDLVGATSERHRRWDSCFSEDFSYIHGGPVRASTKARYRQWMTHKLASWADQFDAAGCVGCGRCITWCPVGIDITEELAAIRASAQAGQAGTP